jgi:hypothetical protein
MQTSPVRCRNCGNTFTVPGDLMPDANRDYCLCPECLAANDWDVISWDEHQLRPECIWGLKEWHQAKAGIHKYMQTVDSTCSTGASDHGVLSA